jgi:hypothetical protein
MNLLHFGTAERPLFGAYHAPRQRPVRPDGVVIAPAIGLDYVRTHRALRRLTDDLTAAGHHVFRFDVYGTGDSGGDGRSVSLEGCMTDLELAIEELRATSGVLSVSLVGVRLGASVACLVARSRDDIETIVLWDPVVHGGRHLASLLRRARTAGNGARNGTGPGDVEVDGFPLPRRLREEVAALDLTEVDRVGARRAVILASGADGERAGLETHLVALGLPCTRLERPDPGVWDARDRLGRAVLAPELLKEVPRCLS